MRHHWRGQALPSYHAMALRSAKHRYGYLDDISERVLPKSKLGDDITKVFKLE
jgi:hypothetical protein